MTPRHVDLVLGSCAIAVALVLALPSTSTSCDHGSSPCGAGEVNPDLLSDPGIVQSGPQDPHLGKVQGLGGVGSACQMLMGFDFIAGLDTYWKGGLDWINNKAVQQSVGVAWEAYIDWPGLEGIYAHPTAAWNAQALAEGYVRSGNQRYLRTALEAMRWLNSDWVPMSNYPAVASPQGYVYLENYWPQIPSVHIFSNTVFNQIAIGQAALDVYLVTGDQNALDVARGVADALVATADPGTVGYRWRPFWPANPDPSLVNNPNHYLQRCAGGPGITEFLIQMADDLPPALWNNDYQAYARGSLDWMASLAVPVAGGSSPSYTWPPIEGGSIVDASVTQGRGVSGVGRAFLIGYQAFGDPAYRDYAVGAANWLIQESVLVSQTGRHWDDQLDDTGFGPNNAWCVGHLGITQFLGSIYEETGNNTYGLAYLESVAWMDQQTIPTAFGPMFPYQQNGSDHGSDFFFGFTGLGNYHHETIPSIWTVPPAINMNVNALNFLINSAIQEGQTLTWPFKIPFAGYPPGTATEAPMAASISWPTADEGSKAFANERPVAASDWRGHESAQLEETSQLFAASRGFSVMPNPVRDETTIRFSRAEGSIRNGWARPVATLEISDVSGRVVRSLEPSADGNALEWEWDARDERGRRVAQGMYFGRVSGSWGNGVAPTRIAVLK